MKTSKIAAKTLIGRNGEAMRAMRINNGLRLVGIALGSALVLTALPFANQSSRAATTPIQHIVVIDMENHSFNELLGQVCIIDLRPNCTATARGRLSNGQPPIDLKRAPDLVPDIGHKREDQIKAMNGGRMNKFDRINGCTAAGGYKCYVQYYPDQIPNTAALARQFAISDHTFEFEPVPSYGSHIALVAATLDGFVGNQPKPVEGVTPGPGWGCDSNKVADWQSESGVISQPSCVPDTDGSGPFMDSEVPWVPTIMDEMDAASPQVSWKIYVPRGATGEPAHGPWAVCPSFASCLFTSQVNNMRVDSELISDAANGTLPEVSFVIPSGPNSQHNGHSMIAGENYLNKIITPLMNGPQWSSTAVFLTWDDCGCFYDPVAPTNPQFAVRVPMIIISPYAKPGYTDTTPASYPSILAFIEHNFALPPLNEADAGAYDFSDSFDYGQAPVRPVKLVTRAVPQWELEYIEKHPVVDPDDPVSDE